MQTQWSKASTGCSPPTLSGCDPDKFKDHDMTKSKIQGEALPRRKLSILILGYAPGSGSALNGYAAKGRTRGLAQNLIDSSGEAEPRLTSGGEAGVEASSFRGRLRSRRRHLTAGGEAATLPVLRSSDFTAHEAATLTS